MNKEKLLVCHFCGSKILPGGNVCFNCGSQYNSAAVALANAKFEEQDGIFSIKITHKYKFDEMIQESRFNDGIKLLFDMELTQAIQYYAKMVIEQPNEVELWNNYGVANMGLCKRRQALLCYERALTINPNYFIGLYNVGAVYMVCGVHQKAFKYFDKALEVNPKCAEAYWDKHIIREKQGEWDLSEKDIEKEMNIQRARMNNSSALIDLGKEKETILGSFEIYFKYEVEISDLFQQVLKEKDNGNNKNALKILDKILNINSEHINSLFIKAEIFKEQGRYLEALELYDKVTKIDPSRRIVWQSKFLIKVQNLTQNAITFNEALMDLDIVLEINPFSEELKKYEIDVSKINKKHSRIDFTNNATERWLKFDQAVLNLDKIFRSNLNLSEEEKTLKEKEHEVKIEKLKHSETSYLDFIDKVGCEKCGSILPQRSVEILKEKNRVYCPNCGRLIQLKIEY